ncbi:MAG TPA: M24 family metallopeptidase [Spirochaetia bacterium]|nr:M24 family metallopeptidase [Spirochaetia bacterium]
MTEREIIALIVGDMLSQGAVYRGYCSDISRNTVVGRPPSRELRKAFEACCRVLDAAASAVKPGVPSALATPHSGRREWSLPWKSVWGRMPSAFPIWKTTTWLRQRGASGSRPFPGTSGRGNPYTG